MPTCEEIIAFKLPAALFKATKAAADRDMSTVSHVVRTALLRDLRERGLLEEA